jgi:glycosyltransferase involved in cell wall biosynthesis
MSENGSICILPILRGMGGPVSFRARIAAGLQERGYEVHQDPSRPDCKSILVIGGISRMDLLVQARRRGVRIVQRLNGMNWIHRKRPTSLKNYLRSEWNNWVLASTRRYLADQVIYQSQFARNWWQTVHGTVRSGGKIIYNGVDLAAYTPDGAHQRPQDHYRLLLVEAHLTSHNAEGLENAIHLAEQLNRNSSRRVELMAVGEVSPELKSRWESKFDWITWAGVAQREQIPEIDRSAHLLFSADLNAACPNSVIEALACGLPVVSFATGSLPELLVHDAGRVAPYGSNYWNLEPPDISALASAAEEILADPARFSQAARARAIEAFDVAQMVDNYLAELI